MGEVTAAVQLLRGDTLEDTGGAGEEAAGKQRSRKRPPESVEGYLQSLDPVVQH